MEDTHNYVLRLTKHEIRALTKVLFLHRRYYNNSNHGTDGTAVRPAPEWLASQRRRVAGLPLYLLGWDLGLLSRLWHGRKTAHYLRLKEAQRDAPRPRYAILCDAHARLDRAIIRHVFLLVAREASTHLAAVCRYAGGEHRTPAVADFEDRMLGVNGLWMTDAQCAALGARVGDKSAAGEVAAAAGFLPSAHRLPMVESNCEACILAAIGGSEQILIDLAASLISRAKGSPEKPRFPMLLTVVEAWIDHFGHTKAEQMDIQAAVLSEQLRTVRKAAKRKHGGHSSGYRRSHHSRHHHHDRNRSKQLHSSTRSSSGDSFRRGVLESNLARQEKPLPAVMEEADKEWHQPNDFADDASASLLQPQRTEGREGSPHGLTQEERDAVMGEDDSDHEAAWPDHINNGKGVSSSSPHFARKTSPYEFTSPAESEALGASICEALQELATSGINSGRASQVDFSGVHPAFRPFVAQSAVPTPLHMSPRFPPTGGHDDYADARSWVTDTVHTEIGNERFARDDADAPPVPAIPAEYSHPSSSSGDDNKPKKVHRPRPESIIVPRSTRGYAASSVYSNDEPAMPPSGPLDRWPSAPVYASTTHLPLSAVDEDLPVTPRIEFSDPFADTNSRRRVSTTSTALSPRARRRTPVDTSAVVEDDSVAASPSPPTTCRTAQPQHAWHRTDSVSSYYASSPSSASSSDGDCDGDNDSHHHGATDRADTASVSTVLAMEIDKERSLAALRHLAGLSLDGGLRETQGGGRSGRRSAVSDVAGGRGRFFGQSLASLVPDDSVSSVAKREE